MIPREEQHSIPWEPFYNATNETIDAHSCIRLTTSKTVHGNILSKCEKPDDYGAQFHHRLTFESPVEPDGIGYCSLPVAFPMLAAHQGGQPAAFEAWGPTDGFKIRQGVGGFRVLGVPPDSQLSDVVLVYFDPILSLTAVLSEELESGGTAEAAPVDSAHKFDVHEVLGLVDPLEGGSKIRVQWDVTNMRWEVISAGCTGA